MDAGHEAAEGFAQPRRRPRRSFTVLLHPGPAHSCACPPIIRETRTLVPARGTPGGAFGGRPWAGEALSIRIPRKLRQEHSLIDSSHAACRCGLRSAPVEISPRTSPFDPPRIGICPMPRSGSGGGQADYRRGDYRFTNCQQAKIIRGCSGIALTRSSGFSCTTISRLLRKRFDRRARGLGLTKSQWIVLAHLARARGHPPGRARRNPGARARDSRPPSRSARRHRLDRTPAEPLRPARLAPAPDGQGCPGAREDGRAGGGDHARGTRGTRRRGSVNAFRRIFSPFARIWPIARRR